MRKDAAEKQLEKLIDKKIDIDFDYADVKKRVDFSALEKPSAQKNALKRALPWAITGGVAAVAAALIIVPMIATGAFVKRSYDAAIGDRGGDAYNQNAANADRTEDFDRVTGEQFDYHYEGAPDPTGAISSEGTVRIDGQTVTVTDDNGNVYTVGDDVFIGDKDGDPLSIEDLTSGETVLFTLSSDGQISSITKK